MATGGGTSHLAPEARQRLEEELAGLRERRRELAAALENETDVGDGADAAEVLELREDLIWVDEQIAEIIARLAGSEPVGGAGDLPDGTEVTLRFEDGTVVTLRVVAFPKEAPEGAEDTVLTLRSPLGRALAGHRSGDNITHATPDGPARATLLDLRPPAGG
ncbi:MAG: GreA/GreB family elongation factor [Pseudonocardiaceae bacterium]